MAPHRRRYRRLVHRFRRLRRGDRRDHQPESVLPPGRAGRRSARGHAAARRAHGIRAEDDQLFHPRHHGRHQHRHPAQGPAPGAVHDRGISGRAGDGAAEDPRHVQPAVQAPGAADPARHVFGIAGRIDADGAEETPLDEASVEQAPSRAARGRRREGIVIALLHAYRNPAHERARARRSSSASRPACRSFCSSETWPIIREYERTITAVIGGYVQPRVAHYLTQLQAALRAGRRAAGAARHQVERRRDDRRAGQADCVQMILSGTASGVIGAELRGRARRARRAA